MDVKTVKDYSLISFTLGTKYERVCTIKDKIDDLLI